MHNTIKLAVAGFFTATALTVGAAPGVAAPAEDDPCATQVAQVAKAEDALARVTAVFERQQTKVKKAKNAVKHADTSAEENAAEKALDRALEKKDKAKKAKKAQLQRLARAQQRLDDCLAEQPSN